MLAHVDPLPDWPVAVQPPTHRAQRCQVEGIAKDGAQFALPRRPLFAEPEPEVVTAAAQEELPKGEGESIDEHLYVPPPVEPAQPPTKLENNSRISRKPGQ